MLKPSARSKDPVVDLLQPSFCFELKTRTRHMNVTITLIVSSIGDKLPGGLFLRGWFAWWNGMIIYGVWAGSGLDPKQV